MNEHYFSEKQSSKRILRQIVTKIRGKEIKLYTSSGVFSAKKIDAGTRLLAENMVVKKEDKVLDLGCGVGVLGIVAAGLTKNEVILVDINARACEIARANSEHLKNIKVIQGDMFNPIEEERFDVILLNPPQTAGKMLCFEMIEKSKKHLKEGGTLQLVARHKKGGAILSKEMIEVFGNMETIANKGGYRIYVSRNT